MSSQLYGRRSDKGVGKFFEHHHRCIIIAEPDLLGPSSDFSTGEVLVIVLLPHPTMRIAKV